MSEVHTTCYADTFITLAPDATTTTGVAPPVRLGAPASVAARTYAMIAGSPYGFTSDDVIFTVWADRHGIADDARSAARAEFFSVGRPCLRASDLGKRYGWGIHHDAAGRVALYPVDGPDYAIFCSGVSAVDGTPVTVRPAMRSHR